MSTSLPSLPDPIGLGYRTWHVQYDKGVQDDEYGELVTNRGLILVMPGMDPVAVVDTVLHELLHAMLHNTTTTLTTKQAETVITQLAHGLTELIDRNPEFMEWIDSQLREETE